MRPAFLRTLSARILFGFVVLIATFGATSAWIVTYMDAMQSEISVIRTGYLRLALTTKDLSSRQHQLWQYLKEELASEATPRAVDRWLRRYRNDREKLLGDVEQTLVSMRGLPRGHSLHVRRAEDRIAMIREKIKATEEHYLALLAAPPIERSTKLPTPAADPAQLEAAVRAHTRLIDAEGSIANDLTQLSDSQQRIANGIAKTLEKNATRLRTATLVMGLVAMAIGLLITLWAVINLRPLARLRVAAGRIARGEHGSLLDEKGPSEVADLAREFNVMARAIEERERELVRSERLAAVGKMAAMITHEVRNPLSSIALNTELLGDELDELPEAQAAEARALCRSITAEVDRLTAITEEYLAFARLPKPRLSVEPVNHVVSALATFVREDLAGRGVKLDVTLAEPGPRALIDEGQLRQSLLNLVRNAAEALVEDGGGTVWLSTRQTGEHVELEVRDDGPGVAPEVAAKLFDPFVSTKDGGTGLGLALTHQIVREHGGDIRVASEPGKGATFVVVLPVADA